MCFLLIFLKIFDLEMLNVIERASDAIDGAFNDLKTLKKRFINYASAATAIACVDDGVAPKTEEQVKSDGLLNVSCSYTLNI